MKKIFTLLTAILIITVASAQDANTLVKSNVVPQNALQVSVTVKKEIVKSGPYARYAQQYLGVIAPLNDRTSYQITDAHICIMKGEMSSSKQSNASADDITFNDMGINPIVQSVSSLQANRMATREKSLQDMASDAANTIFNLRKKRVDIITGETQDVYGAGMEAALKEISRIEQEYTDLFLGKKIVTYATYNFGVIPTQGKLSYVLCKFSTKNGIVDILSSEGSRIALSLVSENSIKMLPQDKGSKNTLTESVIVPDWVTATLLNDTKPITSTMVELYQFGKLIVPTK